MTEPATDELIAEIEAGLEGVTPGPWEQAAPLDKVCTGYRDASGTMLPSNYGVTGHSKTVAKCAGQSWMDDGEEIRNAAHIARCHPGNIAALIARIRQAEAERDEERSAANALLSQNEDLRDAWANVKSERDQALARIKVMDEALKPFDKEADYWGEYSDDRCLDGVSPLTVGELRAARAARKEPTNE